MVGSGAIRGGRVLGGAVVRLGGASLSGNELIITNIHNDEEGAGREQKGGKRGRVSHRKRPRFITRNGW